ncbi:MAG: tetratricopeptide (TPR) repeat protein [Planctomycetota bacterium]|jgi:tetratricopeptide (TPR) repeat protein
MNKPKYLLLPALLGLLCGCPSSGGGGGGGGSDPGGGPPTEDEIEESDELTQEALDDLTVPTTAGLIGALEDLERALELNPDNDLAAFLYAPTSIAVFALDLEPGSELGDLLARYGLTVTNGDITDSIYTPPTFDGSGQLPSDSPHGREWQAAAYDILAPLLRRAANHLANIDEDFQENLSVLDELIEIDRGDARLMEAGLQMVVASCEMQGILSIDGDIDHVLGQYDNDEAYALYTGSDPLNPLPNQECDGRFGFLNERDLTASGSTLLPTEDADVRLANIQAALIRAVQAFGEGMTFIDPPNGSDFIQVDEEQRHLYDAASPWFLDLLDALEGAEPTVEELNVGHFEGSGFRFVASIAFDKSTYGGRPFIPVMSGTCQLDADSFAHAFTNSNLVTLVDDMGETLEASDLFEIWYALDGAWSDAFDLGGL